MDQVDLEAFLDAYKTAVGLWDEYLANDPYAICSIMENFDDTPMPAANIDETDRKDLASRLADDDWLVFFPMHQAAADEHVRCIDGSEAATDDLDIGVADAYGFLVEVRDGQVHFHPAFYDGSSNMRPKIDLQAHCSVLDDKMETFVRRFVQWV